MSLEGEAATDVSPFRSGGQCREVLSLGPEHEDQAPAEPMNVWGTLLLRSSTPGTEGSARGALQSEQCPATL